jgi:hypothetical protein
LNAQPQDALETQAKALLEGVASDRDQRCAALRAAANSQAHQIVCSARAEALANLRKAIAQERTRIDQGLKDAEARVELEILRHAQQESRTLLEHLWAESGEALERRWRDAGERRMWIEAALAEAGTLLAGRAWSVEHGAGWSDSERGELEAQARHQGSSAVELREESSVQAGLRVRAESVCIDATILGLLARREDVEAAFLAEYLAAGAQDAAPGKPT